MTTENVGHHTFSAVAGADLSAKQYYFVKLDSNGAVVVAGAGEAACGVLQNNPTSGQTATVAYGGISFVKSGGSITAGALVASDSAGKATTATKASTNTGDTGGATDALVGSHVMGFARRGASSGDIFPVLLAQMGAAPTTAA